MSNKGIGKGLAALLGNMKEEETIAEKSESAVSREIMNVDISLIDTNPYQPRKVFDKAALEELAASIKTFGIIQPLIVLRSGNRYVIIAGERRFRAARLAGLTSVPCVVRELTPREMREIALIENLQRSDLNPVEEAKGYRQLIDASGMTQEALSKAVSKSRSAITNSLRLLDLPEVVQQMIFEGKLTAGHARAILAVPYEDARIRLAEKVVAEGLSVRATENLAPLFSAGETPKTPRPATPQSFKKAARILRQVFNTNVRVKSSRGKNKIEIEFKDEEELSRILGEMIQFDQGGQDEE